MGEALVDRLWNHCKRILTCWNRLTKGLCFTRLPVSSFRSCASPPPQGEASHGVHRACRSRVSRGNGYSGGHAITQSRVILDGGRIEAPYESKMETGSGRFLQDNTMSPVPVFSSLRALSAKPGPPHSVSIAPGPAHILLDRPANKAFAMFKRSASHIARPPRQASP